MADLNKIYLAANGDSHAPTEEALANAALTPGHLIELISTGKVQKHATAGGSKKQCLIALENSPGGVEITTAYAADERVYYACGRRGDIFNMLIANGENVAIGDELESNGDGTLRKFVADTSALTRTVNCVVGVARTAVDMSGSTLADPSGRCHVQLV